ncbi:MAG TPA: hypothetical protein VGI72_04325 [Gaiellales bacterium]|jgi:hypothetical protein
MPATGESTAMMRHERAQTWFAGTIFGVTLALFGAEAVLGWLARNLAGGASWSGAGPATGIALAVVLLSPPAVGLLIVSRREGNPIGWLLLAIGLAWALADSSAYADYGLRLHPGSLPLAAVPGAVGNAFWVPAIGLTGTLLILLFPDGQLPGPGWRWVARASVLVMAVGTIALLLMPGKMTDAGYPGTVNPLGVDGLAGVLGAAGFVVVLLPALMVASAAGMVVRYRRSRGVERVQMRWLTASGALVALIYGLAFLLSVALTPGTESTRPPWLQVLQTLALFSTALIPIAIGFAVLRYRLYDIDVIIRRTLVYGVLVACMAAIYLGGVYTIEGVVRGVTGGSSTLAVTVSTLAVALVFQPLRRRIQAAVDRRFYRSAYDAAQTLDAFSALLRREIDLDALTDDVLAVVGRTLHPAHVTIWLRPGADT